MRKLLAWAQRNERHLGALVFVLGFATDLVAFLVLDVDVVAALFGAYLALASLCVLVWHALASRPEALRSVPLRTLSVLLPLVAQYLIGNLLSGFLIFYTKSADPLSSWPFLALLAAAFVGNEWFRKYKDRIAFISVLLFFAAYAYVLFAYPLLAGELGPAVYVQSAALAIASFLGFLALLWSVGRARLAQSVRPVLASVFLVAALFSGAYFTGLVPPIPLALREGAVYHDVRREGAAYVTRGEEGRPWWDPRPETVRVASGMPLYAFTAVFAPARFGTVVVHRWQHREGEGSWVTEERIAFPIIGGREGGYRGYSRIGSVAPGSWRVRVETANGQVIGTIRFEVERPTGPIELREETR